MTCIGFGGHLWDDIPTRTYSRVWHIEYFPSESALATSVEPSSRTVVGTDDRTDTMWACTTAERRYKRDCTLSAAARTGSLSISLIWCSCVLFKCLNDVIYWNWDCSTKKLKVPVWHILTDSFLPFALTSSRWSRYEWFMNMDTLTFLIGSIEIRASSVSISDTIQRTRTSSTLLEN
jgi:hypothetical protein